MIDLLFNMVAPHSCCGCGYLGEILCVQCKNDIISEPFSVCMVCLAPSSDSNLCQRCAPRTGYGAAWCVGERSGALKALLDRYKFDSARQAGVVLSELLDARLPVLSSTTVIVPVPTAPAHRRVRGFDHTALITRRFAKERSLRYLEALGTDRTDTQHFKTREQRQLAASNGLYLRGPVPRSVLLVDDIYTTGSTLAGCTNLLRQAGAETIAVALIARQTLDGSHDL